VKQESAKPKTARKAAEKSASASAIPARPASMLPAKPSAGRATQSSVQVPTPVKRQTSTTNIAPSTTPIFGLAPYMPGKNVEYMSPAQGVHFRKILLAWRQELMEEADRTMHHLQDEAANLPDPNDRATQEEEFALELRARDRERKLLKKIEQALDKVDKGDYGWCEACGIEIGIRRLEARPTAELCIDCKELAEIKEKQLAG